MLSFWMGGSKHNLVHWALQVLHVVAAGTKSFLVPYRVCMSKLLCMYCLLRTPGCVASAAGGQ
jgi:uncharacterized membrane protein